MSDLEPPARHLVAGAVGPERRPYRKDPDEPRWFEPIHVRAPGVAREAMARSVEAGADVLVAPTWLTHRRALLPVGETRRAAAWTAAAVRVAREAVDRGLELRERATDAAAEAAERGGPAGSGGPGGRGTAAGSGTTAGSGAAGAPAVPRNPVRVAGVLPFLGGLDEADSGKLAPRDAGVERDLRAAAGLLAEAEVDLLLVDGGPAVAGARAAADAAVETGLPAWLSVPVHGSRVPELPSGEAIEAWAASMIHAGVTGFLLVPSPGCDVAVALERLRAAGVRAEQTGVLPMLLGASGAAGTAVAASTDEAVDDDGPSWPWARDAEPRSYGEGGPGRRAQRRAQGGAEAAQHRRTAAAGDADSGRSAADDGLGRLERAATGWLEAGAWHLGFGDGATPERLAALRAAMDEVDGTRLAARAAARDRWGRLVAEAARRAPGGRAAWIGPHDAAAALPAGFAWTVVPAEGAATLPVGDLRLVVAAAPVPADRLAPLLEPGGILLGRDLDVAAVLSTGLRLLDVSESPAAILARRDP